MEKSNDGTYTIPLQEEAPTPLNTSKIVLHGHTHHYSATVSNKNILHVSVPALCEILNPIPSALEMTLKFKKDSMNTAFIKQLMVVNNSVVGINEIEFRLKGFTLQADNEDTAGAKKKELTINN